jgi:hypothetical protein
MCSQIWNDNKPIARPYNACLSKSDMRISHVWLLGRLQVVRGVYILLFTAALGLLYFNFFHSSLSRKIFRDQAHVLRSENKSHER